MSQYDPGRVVVVIGGKTMAGFHTGSFVKCNRTNDTWKLEVGADGNPVWVKSRDKSGDIVITLQGTSPSNDDLSEIAVADERDDAVPEEITASVTDMNGTTLWSSANARVLKPADAEFADEHTPREWTVKCGKLEWFNGGSDS